MNKHIDHSVASECGKKPLEIYVFIDPLCPECWALEPILKKLQIEYGKHFSIRHVLSGRLASLNLRKATLNGSIANVWERTASRSGMSCDGDIWFENPISTPFTASIAIKAAELQGRRVGLKFLRKLQELLFLQKQNISDEDVLVECAREVGLEMDEFVQDLHSESAAKAFQCDLQITSDMEVDQIPTLVFFNENIEEEGMKVTGLYSYDVYVRIIQDLLQASPEPSIPPPLEEFLQYFKFVATKEISVVYNLEPNEVEKEMKKLLLKQKVEVVPVKYGTFWRYIE
ncbi:putative DsbA family dithiol-disulfide isomerase [Bacillus mesophilus]|uniref:DsbA family protein n=1 Tax=Bacillus mesophilus TaxID=1808955 RepID=UPI0013D028F6|nr:putative DsbA family dithiol-disulfide isomerase [Bacillus mesophilus]